LVNDYAATKHTRRDPSSIWENPPFHKLFNLAFQTQSALALGSYSGSRCLRSSLLSLTTYFFTEISFPAMTASIVNNGDGTESQNPIKLVDTGD
jgi:hypothetical protein